MTSIARQIRPHLRRVKEGDPISAAEYNRLVDAVDKLSQFITLPTAPIPRFVFARPDEVITQYGRGKKIDVLQYDDDQVASDSDPVVAVDGVSKFNGADITNGIWLDGERHLFYYLAHAGAMIPLVTNLQLHLGKLDGALSPGGTATASLWRWDDASGFVDTTENYTVYDWLMKTGESISSGKKIITALMQRIHIVIAAECE